MAIEIPHDPIEEALEHVSFHAAIASTFLETYQEYREYVPLEVVALAVPMALHAPTRQLLTGNKKSSLIGLIGKNPMIKTHTVAAARRWHSDALRAIGLLWRLGAVEVTSDSMVRQRQALAVSGLQDKDNCLSKARLLGHILGKVGNAKTTFALLEVTA